MWFQARITAYDALDVVHVSARVHGDDGTGAPLRLLGEFSCTVKGAGESEAVDWLRDALVAILETL